MAAVGPSTFSSRRRAPRVSVEGRLYGHIVGLNIAVDVIEIGFGGVSLGSPAPFSVGARHVLRLTTEDGSAVQVRARAAHCRRAPAAARAGYIVGWEFVRTPDADRAIMRLMDSVTGVLVFQTA